MSASFASALPAVMHTRHAWRVSSAGAAPLLAARSRGCLAQPKTIAWVTASTGSRPYAASPHTQLRHVAPRLRHTRTVMPSTNSRARSFATSAADRTGFMESLGRGWYAGAMVLGVLVAVAIGSALYTDRTWPDSVRQPLKDALKARNRGDYERAETYFVQAIEAANRAGPAALGPDSLLKITGLYITYAAMLEDQGKVFKAYCSLRTALSKLGEKAVSSPSSAAGKWAGPDYRLTPADHIRAISIAQKLGQLALQVSTSVHAPPFPIDNDSSGAPIGWLDAAETYLSTALTAMLKLGLNKPGSDSPAGGSEQRAIIAGRDVDLGPELLAVQQSGPAEGRVDKTGLGMTMEALAEVYAKKKQYDLSGQLLLQAISILLPAATQAAPPIQDRCQAALLMTTLSSHSLHPRTPEAIKISRSWSLRSLQIADQAIADSSGAGSDGISNMVCKRARAISLHGLGMLAEIEGNTAAALATFEDSHAQAKDIDFAEGQREAMVAVRRMRNQTASAGSA